MIMKEATRLAELEKQKKAAAPAPKKEEVKFVAAPHPTKPKLVK